MKIYFDAISQQREMGSFVKLLNKKNQNQNLPYEEKAAVRVRQVNWLSFKNED